MLPQMQAGAVHEFMDIRSCVEQYRSVWTQQRLGRGL